MAAIVEELTIEAAPQRVYNALTQQDEIARWWAYEAHVKPEVGSVGEFRFRQGAFVMQLEVAELVEDKKVRWVSRQVPPQWVGTSVTWLLTPVHNGTTVLFTQEIWRKTMQLTYRWRATLVIALGLLMSVLDVTIVSVVLPQIATALHADYQTTTWIGTGYLLANAAVIPVIGYLSDRIGSKTIFLLDRHSEGTWQPPRAGTRFF
jgi:uncharacterized protein YndB with AHSA1/START domain